MSYLSQMVGLTYHNFVSAAAGIAVAAALVRGIARNSATTIGNFWADLIRINLYLLVPICVVYAVFLVSQGMIQNFKPYDTAHLTAPLHCPNSQERRRRTRTQGRSGQASDGGAKGRDSNHSARTNGFSGSREDAGTNGGGFTNANAAHPFENPTPLSNFLQMLSILLIPSGLTYYLGRMVKNQRHGWAVWAAMAAIFLVGLPRVLVG